MRILKSILFATDFHSATHDVARVAVQLASVFDSHVTLLHVLEPAPTDPTELRQQREQATTRMRELVEQLELDKIVLDEGAIAIGSAADTIVGKAQEIAADLILIGAGESSRFDRAAGSTAQAVLQHALRPVLAVRPGEPAVNFHQIFCPVDHSKVSQRGLENAIRLARAFHGNVVVLSVVPATKAAERAQAGGQPKLSALTAAAKVLAETGQAMTCKELIAAMAAGATGPAPPARRPRRRCTRP